MYGEGLKADGTPDSDGYNDSHNIFIEGENLEVLKILQKAYAGKIKMIYIDPSYNTGNDFVYDDNFTEPLQEYLRRTGQVDEEGQPLTTNKRADGRFHSKWLSMMYPRMRLARNLLRDDGVIFIASRILS
ncbi:MAG: DNA methyltransferase [bacterium]|nr:DNA methyltransferase [bacterium]